jgi:tRNA pseudouridine55 synthase
MNGIIIVNKPKGCTSFGVIAALRKVFNQKKIGHTGTLDPLATGVLPVLLGSSAKALQFIKEHPKQYIASMKLGVTTDTQDITGNILRTSPVQISLEDIKNALQQFIGKIYQIPPMYSAIKKNGKKLYEFARKGIDVKREKRLINILIIDLLKYDAQNQIVKIKVTCSPGTYIRTLISDVGDLLLCGAAMADLVRTQSDGFSLENSFSAQQLKTLSMEDLSKIIIPTSYVLKHYDAISVTEAQKTRFKNGGGLSFDRIDISNDSIKNGKIYQISCNNKFIGLGVTDTKKQELSVLKNF